jgi:hypothetical protein
MKITQEQILKMNRAHSREMEIANGRPVSHVFRNKKTYSRKQKHANSY